jgi:hypothetical protein
MPGMPRELIEHSLNVHPKAMPKKQLWQNQPELHRLKYASPRWRATSYFKRYNTIGLSSNVPINHRTQDPTRYLTRRWVQRYKYHYIFTPQADILQKYTKHHQFPVKGDYYKTGLSFTSKHQSLKSVNTIHVVITDIMLALAWYHAAESVLVGDGSHSTDQPSGKG